MPEEIWIEIEKELHIDGDRCTFIEKEDRRIYLCEKTVCKVIIVNEKYIKSNNIAQDLENEFKLMSSVSDLKLSPEIISFAKRHTYHYLVLDRINGTRFDCADISLLSNLIINVRIVISLIRISFRGIVHGDVIHHNIFIVENNKIKLIDFGHGTRAGVFKALALNLFLKRGHPNFNRPYLVTMIRSIEFSLPSQFRGIYRKILGIGTYNPEY